LFEISRTLAGTVRMEVREMRKEQMKTALRGLKVRVKPAGDPSKPVYWVYPVSPPKNALEWALALAELREARRRLMRHLGISDTEA